MPMASTSFADVPFGPPDPMFHLKKASDGDASPDKIDVGIGVYRGQSTGYHEFGAIKEVRYCTTAA
jgi:aspartate aminotransferase, cytoplasmic